MGVKSRNQSGDFIQVPVASGLVAATVAVLECAYPFVRNGVMSHLVLAAGAKPTGGTSTAISLDIIKNPTNVTASAVTGGTSIFGATKPSWTWGTAGALAGDYIEFGTYGAGNEVLSSRIPAGWSAGTGLTSGVLNGPFKPGDSFAVAVTLNGTATTGTIMSVLFSFDVYPGA
jgi:hypothetical protein